MNILKFLDQDINHNDERILKLENKIVSEVYTIIALICLIHYIYNKYYLGQTTYSILLISIFPVYRDIRFAMEGAYNFNSKNIRISKFYLFAFMVCLSDLLVYFIECNWKYNFLSIYFLLTTILIMFYENIIKYFYKKWKDKNLIDI
ncbi:DUF6773 family protein [Clostridium sporogenes]|uniref:DUF6773 family protein n=1 Tax=Clostridium sporogenes TaxID=1509 RepID=UPI00313B01A9